MLKKYKKDRIVLLTTHYMDEADILGDRIAIMKRGRLECLGSSMFLKQKFAVGYILKIQKMPSFDETKAEAFAEFIFQALGHDISFDDETDKELTINIPTRLQEKFKEFFDNFDSSLGDLGIKSYNIQMTTLTEVFDKVGRLNLAETPDGNESVQE